MSSSVKKRNSQVGESSSASNSDDSKSKPKKARVTLSLGNTDILTNLGLTNNHLSPQRKNNTLLNRPEVTMAVNKQFYVLLLVLN